MRGLLSLLQPKVESALEQENAQLSGDLAQAEHDKIALLNQIEVCSAPLSFAEQPEASACLVFSHIDQIICTEDISSALMQSLSLWQCHGDVGSQACAHCNATAFLL